LQHQEWLQQQPSRLKAWRQLVDDTLQGAGYRIQKIEARGDCCFIAMMAGDDREIPIVKVTSLNDNARDFYVTKKRKALVERFMTEVAGQKEGAWLTRKELLNVAVMLDMKLPKGRALAATGTQMQLDFNNLQMRNIKQAMRRELAPWCNPLYYGMHQEVVMTAFGWMLQRNVLQLAPLSNTDLGALAFESAAPFLREHCCASSTTLRPHACLALSGARVLSLRGQDGRPVFPHRVEPLEAAVNLLRDDLEDTVLHGRVNPEIRAYRACAMRLPA
jgi:hypothetical protein